MPKGFFKLGGFMTFHIEQRPGKNILNKKHKLEPTKAGKQKRTKKASNTKSIRRNTRNLLLF